MRTHQFVRAFCALLVLFLSGSFAQEKLSLAGAIESALRDNPELGVARESLGMADGRFWRDISPPSPTLSVTREYVPVGRSVSHYQEQSVALSQTIEFPVSWYIKGRILNESQRQAGERLRLSKISLAARVKAAYYAARGAIEKRLLAAENEVIARDFARRAEARFRAGEATPLEVQTAKVQLGQAEQEVERATKEVRLMESQLLLLMGKRRSARTGEIVLVDSLQYVPETGSLDQYLQLAGSGNPSLQISRSKKDAASKAASLAWWSIFPEVSLSYLWQSRDGNPGYYGVGFGVSLPVWSLFERRGKIQEAAAEQRASELELLSTENRVGFEIEQAWLELKESERRIQRHLSDLLPQSEEAHRTALLSYTSGEIMYLEYLQARQLLIQSRSQYIDALVQVNISRARLEDAVGIQTNE